ncbi:NUDIX domain-containing protein [Virgibacillus sp. 7505]|uniref:NUDIX domain-containing protein n=1 Tax=Virgibacillus sp. 7505 TaxID=2022548 RepID=UPI00336A199B
MEMGESTAETALREVFEETGLQLGDSCSAYTLDLNMTRRLPTVIKWPLFKFCTTARNSVVN